MREPPGGGDAAIVVERTRAALAERAVTACTWRARLVGLLGRREFAQGEALIFPRCNSIHTVGMRVPIDVVFVTSAWRVVAVRVQLPPGRLVLPVMGAWGAIELPAGTIMRAALQVGDDLLVSPARIL